MVSHTLQQPVLSLVNQDKARLLILFGRYLYSKAKVSSVSQRLAHLDRLRAILFLENCQVLKKTCQFLTAISFLSELKKYLEKTRASYTWSFAVIRASDAKAVSSPKRKAISVWQRGGGDEGDSAYVPAPCSRQILAAPFFFFKEKYDIE